MADLIRWEPMRLTSLRDAMDNLFEDAMVRPGRIWPAVKMDEPAVDMYQTEKDVVVKASMPGIKADDVDISVTGDMLTISGETCEEKEIKEENYFRREMRCGTFSRTLQIPVSVNVDKSEAVFENGVLTLTMPKSEEAKPKKLAVSSGEAAAEAGQAGKATLKKPAAKKKAAKSEA